MRCYRIRAAARRSILALVFVLCCGCADQAVAPAATPSPTIAAAAGRLSPSPGLPTPAATRPPAATAAPPSGGGQATAGGASTAQPTATPAGTPDQPSTAATPVPFTYLWPSYLPADMQLSAAESRVAREGEFGQNGLGFFIVTFNAPGGKLVIGGGATETLPLTGEQRRIAVGSRMATLTTNGDQRQIVFDVPQGSLFVYSSTLSEEELLRVAGSLQPIDVRELRKRVGAE